MTDYLGFIIIGLLLITIYVINNKKRCPQCNNFIKTKLIAKDDLGKDFSNMSNQKFRIVYKCKNCGYVWTDIETESNDSS